MTSLYKVTSFNCTFICTTSSAVRSPSRWLQVGKLFFGQGAKAHSNYNQDKREDSTISWTSDEGKSFTKKRR